MEQSIHYKAGRSLLHRGTCITKKTALLQSWGGITIWGESYYKVEQVIYYKVGQSLLQSGVGIIKWGNFIKKWGRYYKKGNYYGKGQHIFVAVGQMQTHVY